jgi:hypothetical protein
LSDDLKIGDIVTCGRSGWWRVKSLDPQNQSRIIIEMVLDSKGSITKKGSRVYSASKTWCQKVTVNDIKRQKEEYSRRWDILLFMLDPSQVEDRNIVKILEWEDKPEPDYLANIGPPPSLLRKQ